ncbi:extracellular solute-binding protein [Paenibacillus sp. MBLB4367]|uniref:extracellular solute-binding protein n=1 Tax=Paenibacillus sp. MBLB4367 TaxID=3384767 RepID=UPI0039081B1E
MKKKVKSALIMTLVLATGAVSACSTKKDTDTPQPQGNGAATATPAATDSGKRETIEIFSSNPNANSALPPESEDFVKQAIEKKFNVTLKLTYNMVEGTDRYNKLNVRLASNDSPDIIVSGGTPALDYKKNGVLADINEFVSPEKMPNYFKWTTPEVVFKRYSMDKSKPEIQRIPIPVVKRSLVSYYIRQDWLDKLGLKVPTNLDEFMKVAHAFTFNDPDGNGKNDTYGFSVSAGGNGTGVDWPQFAANGLEGVLYTKDNKVVHYQMDPRTEAVLRDINKMVKDGSVDPDWFLQKGTAHIDKAVQGKVGIIRDASGKFGLESVPTSGASRSKEINPKAAWTAFNPNEGIPFWQENLPGPGFLVTKTAAQNPAKVQKAFQIIDYLSSEEGYLLSHYGKEGVHYTRKGNVITIMPENVKRDIEDKGNWLGIYQVFNQDEARTIGLEVIDPRETDKDREIIKKLRSYPISTSIGTNVAPPQGVDLPAQSKLENETMAKIALGELPPEQWKTTLDKIMNELGGKALLDSYTEQARAAGVIK